jgi:hypothetical protein
MKWEQCRIDSESWCGSMGDIARLIGHYTLNSDCDHALHAYNTRAEG